MVDAEFAGFAGGFLADGAGAALSFVEGLVLLGGESVGVVDVSGVGGLFTPLLCLSVVGCASGAGEGCGSAGGDVFGFTVPADWVVH